MSTFVISKTVDFVYYIIMRIVYTSTNFRNSIYRSVISILLGLVLMIWPGAALRYIIMLIGVIFLITGLVALIVSYKNREEHPGKMASFAGFGSIILGLLLVCFPSSFATIFMFLLGFILVVAAIGQFVTLAAARQFGYVAPVSYLFPVIILIAGIVVLFNPFSSAEGVFMLFGATIIFYGITDLINQYSINKLRKKNDEKEKIQKMDGIHEVEDADYEEVKD